MSAALQNVDDVYPLTSTQEGMLYHTLSDPVSGVYVNQIVTEISGALDTARFERAWKEVADRHEVLRTSFLWDGLDDPLQVVRNDVATEWRHLDLTSASPADRDRAITEFLEEDRRRGFDLANAPLCRMTVMRTTASQWTWIWSFHHIIIDGWSASLLLDEFFAAYGSFGVEAAKPRQRASYRDFVAYHLSRDEEREEAFWTERLAGFTEPPVLEVPGLPPKPDASGYKTRTFDLGEPESTAIVAAARELNVTVNTVVLGTWALVLSRWTRSTDVVFGTTVAGRPASLPGMESATGLFINTLPQRVEVPPSMPVGAWLREVQRGQIETRDYEQSSLAAIQRWSDVEGGRPLFDSIVVFENYPRSDGSNRFADIEVGDRWYVEQSNYPLAVLVIPGDTMRVSFVYDTAVHSEAAIERLSSQVRTVLATIASEPLHGLARIRLTDDEQDTWLGEVGNGPVAEGGGATIHESIRQMANTRPDATAVVDDDGSISYGDLVARAVTVADRLAAAGVGPNRLVGLHLHRSIDMIVGMLGILEAGGAYVPLDPAYPTAHLAGLLADGGIEVVLTTSQLAEGVPPEFERVLLDGEASHPGSVPRQRAGASDLAYVIHTSGSTGRPKGVMVTHENLATSTAARTVHYGDPVGSFLLLSSFSFDSSVAGIFWTLTTGGTLVLPAPDAEHDVAALLALAREHGVTHTLCLPSLYEVLLEHGDGDGDQWDSLRTVIVAGEACPSRILDLHRLRLPGAELHNEYGPTEATVWCTVHRASGNDDMVPIGRPIAGARIFLLDEHGNLVPPGFAGEICVAGSGVVPGYLGRPDLTAERFVSTTVLGGEERLYRTGDLAAWRDDGVLVYLGRGDLQLKIRGHRIEAVAVETALRSHPSISEAVALGRSAPGRPATQLVAFVGTDAEELDTGDVKRHLAASLPDFMVPDLIIALPEIPRLPNGKVDGKSLPDPLLKAERADRVAPRTDNERLLASIWSDLLGVTSIGVRDDFFALGGDSIVSIRMISRARQAGINIAPGQIAMQPTIEQLAASTASASPSGELESTGLVPIGPIQRWFFEMDHPHPDHWNQSNLFELESGVDAEALERALQACFDHHDMLRATFASEDDGWTQIIAPSHPVSFEVVSSSGTVDDVLAQCQRSMDIKEGPLVRAMLIERSGNEPCLLFLAVHHLVIDVVSWTILLDDIEDAYLAASTGPDIVLSPRTTSYRDWVTHLSAASFDGERTHWIAGDPDLGTQPRSFGTEASGRTVTVELDEVTTDLLLRRANDAYRTRPDELMVAALAATLAAEGDPGIQLALEHHGRPVDTPSIDLSRTVGWFTAQYPVMLTTTADDSTLIRTTKETLRNVPNNGLGYGVLRYLDRLPELVNRAEPEYLFNYLGRAPADGGSLLRWISSVDETARHPDDKRAHRIAVVAVVRGDRLVVNWQYSHLHDDRQVVEGMAQSHIDRLRSLISHCVSEDSGALTPSDFPAAGLGQDELDDFLDGLS